MDEDRILITEDKDFGALTFAAHKETPGIILIRFPASARRSLGASLERLLAEYSDRLPGAFTVLQPGTVRISTLNAGAS